MTEEKTGDKPAEEADDGFLEEFSEVFMNKKAADEEGLEREDGSKHFME